jgi:hypothetical protein
LHRCERRIGARSPPQLEAKAHRFGKQKRPFDSPRRHFPPIYPVAFISGERRNRMVNRWCATEIAGFAIVPGVNPMLNRICLKLDK